jgi:hypothetical protein
MPDPDHAVIESPEQVTRASTGRVKMRESTTPAEDINVRILKNIALLALVVAIAATLGKYGIDGVGESRNFAW